MNAKPPTEETLLKKALTFSSAEARRAYLQGACGGDEALGARVQALIEAHEAASGFVADKGTEARPTIRVEPQPLDEQPGTMIGRYKLLQQIGEGGCGVVYMAEQEEPVRRRVALKVIKLGMDTKSVIARFEAERQALALMDHPNIAKVLDAGATETGRPYFVMELVRGIKITEYCDQNNLSTKERLGLFLQVCHAIQHAHQKGIIHRDIKPSNILVSMHDGVPVPVVIDFGIAKATEQRLTDKTLFTAFEQFIGTPAYTSPEQAEMSRLDIDTRSDIYSLGVLLYELLTGKTPFDAKELIEAGLDEMRRTIREKEPARPSTRLTQDLLAADVSPRKPRGGLAIRTAEEVSADSRRRVRLKEQIRLLRGDLDWIVMKALEKDRTRRYETANGLAQDIERHLNNELVTARPPSTAYRFQKMVRRNRTAAVATSSVAFTLILALAFSTAAFVRERSARLEAAAAHRATKVETVRADTVAKFATKFMEGAVPVLYRQGQREPIKSLFGVARELTLELSNAPLAEAHVRFAMARAYDETLYETAQACREFNAVEQSAAKLGPSGQQLAAVARLRGLASRMWEHPEKENARALLEYGQSALQWHPPIPDAAAFAHGVVGEWNMYFGTMDEAERLTREALRLVTTNWSGLIRAQFQRSCSLNQLIILTGKRGAVAEAEQAADEFFAPLQLSRSAETDQIRRQLIEFMEGMWVGDYWTRFPEASLRRALGSLSPDDTAIGGLLQGLLGVAVARGGNWRRGLDLMQAVADDSATSVELWNVKILLAALLDDSTFQHSLTTDGLARYASGTDGNGAGRLVEPLLVLSPDLASLPVVSNLVVRSQQVGPWARREAKFNVALLAYRTGQMQEATKALDELLTSEPRSWRPISDLWRASGLFLRAAVESQLGHSTLAQEYYESGLKLHSPVLQRPGAAYTGDNWERACAAELLRRHAAKCLGVESAGQSGASGQP